MGTARLSFVGDEADIDVVSAGLTMDNINAKKIDLDTVSGDIIVKSSVVEDFDINSG